MVFPEALIQIHFIVLLNCRRETALQFTHLPTNPIWSGTERREGRKGEGDTRLKHMTKNTSAYVFHTPIESCFLLTFIFNIIITAGCSGAPCQTFSLSKSTQEQRGAADQDAYPHCCSFLYCMLVSNTCTQLHMLINSSTSATSRSFFHKKKSIFKI